MYGYEELASYSSGDVRSHDSLLGYYFYISRDADKVMDAMEARIKELEAEAIGYKASLERANFKMCEKDARIKELENIIKVDDAIRITKLEAENARLKKQVPVFHFVADGDLPSDKRDVIAFTKFRRYVDNYLGYYHDEHHWRVLGDVIMWCELPTASTEKENG